MNVSCKRNPNRNYFPRNNSFGKSTYSGYHHDLNPIFDDLCEEAREIARTKGLKSSVDWLYQAEKQGVITTSERVRFSKLIQARNLKNHGGSQYLQVTSKAENYNFSLCIIKTESSFIAKISHLPHWKEVKYRLRDFNIFSSDRGCHVYSSKPLKTLKETDQLIIRWVNHYAKKLDEDKWSDSIVFTRRY